MKCPKIIKTAKISPMLKSILIGAGIGSAGIGNIAAISGYRTYKKKNPKSTLKQYLKSDKKRIIKATGKGAIFGGIVGGIKGQKKYIRRIGAKESAISYFDSLRSPSASVQAAAIQISKGIGNSAKILGLNDTFKYKSQVLRSFREALMMHHINKWEPDKVINALKTIQKTDWYSKLAFLR